jgi:hypothetical protein
MRAGNSDGGVAVAQSREHLGTGPHGNTKLASAHKFRVGLRNSGGDNNHVDRGGLMAHMHLHTSAGKLADIT